MSNLKIIIKRSGEHEKFNSKKIIRAISKAYKACKEKPSQEVFDDVERVFSEVDKEIMTVDEVHDLVEKILREHNNDVSRVYINYRKDHEVVRDFVNGKINFINKYKGTKNTADATIDDNSNVGGKNIGILNAEIHKEDNINVSRGMVLQKLKELYPDFNSKQYLDDLESHIIYKHDESSFAGAIAPYTYSAKEVVTVKYNEHILLLPFDALWNIVEGDEVLVDDKNIVYQKYPENLYVLDKQGWTGITHITKKLRHRDLVRVKTSFGEDIVVTDNHPMIISENIEDTVPAMDSLGEKQYKLGDRGMFGMSESIITVDMAQCNITSEYTDDYCFNQNEHTNCWCKRTVSLDWDLGYFVGFFIGDGNYDNTDGHIHFTQNNRQVLLNLNSIIFKSLGVGGRLYTKKDITNCYSLDIASDYLNWLLKDYFKIQDKSYNKTLPFNIYETNEEFAKGLLCGLIDSDGTVNGCQISIRLSSRSAILQCTHLLRHFGYGVGNIKQSLPFDCNKEYKTNYSLWGVNCSVRKDSINLGNSYKLQNIRISDSSLKYKIDGITKIISVEKLSEEDSFVKSNEFIYDITTSSHTFALNNILVHNCVSMSMYPFLTEGIKKLGGLSAKPKNLDSFCGMYINLIFAVSAQFAGAVATSEFILYFDYFSKKEWGENYYEKADVEITNDHSMRPMTIRKKIHQHFQQVIYSINQPAAARGLQSAFVNFSYFDKPFFEGMFGDFYFPDGTKPTWESICWLQKDFMMWFNEERSRCLLTFPVESFALVYKNGEFLDKDSAEFVAEEYSRGHSFFTYISDTVDSLSSCCRLKNKIQKKEFNFTNGNMGVQTGSKSVITLNLNRIVQDLARKSDDPVSPESLSKYLESILDRVYKYHIAYNELLWDMYEANLLPVYSAGFINLDKQYLTIGLNGLNQAAEFLGIKCNDNDQYKSFCQDVFRSIKDCNSRANGKYFGHKVTFNTECVPAESLAIKNYNWDKEDGYWVPEDTNLYASYVYKPNDKSISVLEKITLHGKNYIGDSLDGGSAAHINLSHHLSKEQYERLLKFAAEEGCQYLTWNVVNSECKECGYISKEKLDVCPKCGGIHFDYYDRVN
jgi:ribonucleoside-triphosphate reductase